MKYRADIDGLRALAILPVLLFHVGATAFSGGYVGVDIFFVISGYIIARVLLDDLAAGRFSILTFYERRIRRIFPALLFVMVLTWLVAYVLLLPSDFVDYSKSLVGASAFISNVYFWKFSGYFENSALLRPLLHTWSLSVEEQFYIFMPAAMFFIHRYCGKRWVLLLVPAMVSSFALSVYALKVGPTANFFLLPTRAWELLLGALLAVAPPPAIQSRWVNEVIAIIAVVMIGWAVFHFTEATPFPGPNALLPCVGAALLIYLGSHQLTLVGRVLSWKPIVGIGLISYSLYLIHWPIAVMMRHYTLRGPTPVEMFGMVVVSVVLAIFSWKYVEQPFRKPRNRAPRRQVLLVGMVTMLLMAGLGYAGVAIKGFPFRFADFVEPVEEKSNHWRNGQCFFEGDADYKLWNAKDCTLTHGRGETVLLWGDSYAAHYVPGIVAVEKRVPYRVLQYTFAGCPPVLSYASYARPNCQKFNSRALDIIKEENVTQLILSARWVDLQLRGLGELRGTLETLAKLGVKVTVIGQSPMFTTNVRSIAYRMHAGEDAAWSISTPAKLNAELKGYSDGARFIDPIAALCEGDVCAYRAGGEFLYSDSGHFSLVGSEMAVGKYVPVFRE
ncbi:MAG: acyltransferase family protein [Rickettsiales bacterium]